MCPLPHHLGDLSVGKCKRKSGPFGLTPAVRLKVKASSQTVVAFERTKTSLAKRGFCEGGCLKILIWVCLVGAVCFGGYKHLDTI